MSIFKTQEQIETLKTKNELIQQETIEKNSSLIGRHNGLCESIAADLDSVIAKFDELRTVEDRIHALGKEPGQIIFAALGFQVTGNVSTSRAFAADARRSIIERIK